MPQIVLKETVEDVDYEIRKLKQAKRMTLRVSPEGRVWISMPLHASLKDARTFLHKNLPYVRATLRRLKEHREQQLQNEATMLPLGGVWHTLDIQSADSYTMNINTTEQKIVFSVPVQEDTNPSTLRSNAIAYWRYAMISRANEELPRRTIELARLAGESIKRVSIRDQKTLWGSCSAGRRHISLNWRCVLFPNEVRDYLIFHELAHLRHQNHSQQYWQWVEKLCPTYRAAEKWLAANGRKIMNVTNV